MIENLKSIAVFSETVRQSSFRAAARELGITPAAVSYHVKLLEEELGTPLFYRSTRKISVTAAGEALYKASLEMLNAAKTGLRQASGADQGLSGQFRITLISALSHSFIADHIAYFIKAYPEVDVQLHYDHRKADLVAEKFDLAIRTGRMEDSSLTCKLIWRMPRCLVASPEYLEETGAINYPDDLNSRCWLKFQTMEAKRRMTSPTGNTVEVEQGGNVVLNSIEGMVGFVLSGVGMASPPLHCVSDYLQSGRLVEILPDWLIEPLPVYAVWPTTKVKNPVTQAFLKDLKRQTG
ncbi:MAG: LysR family transcriptional regulator [Sneathiellales bacterium]|nr:LysR family transcriptional regulator [Sneathiellales bacterium]